MELKKHEKGFLEGPKNGLIWSKNVIFRGFKDFFDFFMEHGKEQ